MMDVERAQMSAKMLLGNFFLGSKSAARQKYPDKDLAFNAQIWALDTEGTGMIHRLHYCDLIIEDHTKDLEALGVVLKTDLYIFRESTVNNEVINGRMFPYERYDYIVERIRGENGLSCRLRRRVPLS